MKRFRTGIDSYSLNPLGLSPFGLLDWVEKNGGDGVQFSEGRFQPNRVPDKASLKELAVTARGKGLYLEWGGGEHIPFDLQTGRAKDIFGANRRAAEQARLLGVDTVRSCSGGLMRWDRNSQRTEDFLKAMAESLRPQKSMLNDLGVILAIETHFEFTTFELRRLFEMCDAAPGDYLGICLDTMNLLTMLEDPVEATRRILPWVVTTHIKDGAIILEKQGLRSFPVEAGNGLIDLRAIIGLLSTAGRDIHLSLEDHGGDFLIPIFDWEFLVRFPDLTAPELCRLLEISVRAGRLRAEGRIEILDRSLWPERCQERVKRGLGYLKSLAGETARHPA